MGRFRRGAKLAARAREALAFARLASMMRHDTVCRLPAQAQAGDDVVVVIHGMLATAGVFRPLRYRLSALPRLHIVSLTYRPGLSIDSVARRFAALVRTLPRGVRLHLVGHSQGGVIARYLATHLCPDALVQTISLAAPFGGADRASWLPWGWGREIAVSSPLLRELRAEPGMSAPPPPGDAEGPSTGVPHLSIVGALDRTARDAPVAASGPYERLVVEGRGHNGLLLCPITLDAVASRIRGSRSEG